MDSILVTGGAGYIGSHTCKALSKAGFLPITYDNLSTGHAYAVKWGPLVVGDLLDKGKLDLTFRTHKPKAVLHFAGSALVSESMTDPNLYYKNNVASSLSLLEAMRTHNVPYIIFSSTCATYGNPQFHPITENHPQAPISPYGRSKWMIEQILADFDKAYKTRFVNLRYFNVAGADLNTEIGEHHEIETHLIPSVIQAALGLKSELVVYGTDFPSPDGTAVRDYIHVQDLAQAHVAALKWLMENQKSVSVNLGTGTGYSVFEIIQSVETFCQKKIPIRLEKKRIGDPSHLAADNRLAKELFSWEPVHSDLPTIIESAWKWHQLLHEHIPILKATFAKFEEQKC